jgi:hypothetical protein
VLLISIEASCGKVLIHLRAASVTVFSAFGYYSVLSKTSGLNSSQVFIHHNPCPNWFAMITGSLIQMMEVWTMMWDQESMEISMLDIASQFEEKKVHFLLFDKINDVLDLISNPHEPMTTDEKKHHFEKLLFDKDIQQVAEFVKIENSGSPDYTVTVLNIDEAVAKFPKWFTEFKEAPWDDLFSHLDSQESDNK